MKKVKQLFLGAILSLATASLCLAQQPFSTCSGSFLTSKMIVDQCANKGRCRMTTTGKLTLQTVSLSPTPNKGLDKLPFQVAINDQSIKTRLLFTKKEGRHIDVRTRPVTCKKADGVVQLTRNSQYALPHTEIVVQ